MRHQLHQTSINQDPGTDAIKHPIDDQRRLAPRRIRHPQAQSYGNSDGRRKSVSDRKDIRRPEPILRPGSHCQSRAETEAFEGLMEDEDDVEGLEFLACDGEGEAYEDGVEHDAEFEDEDGRHLRRVVLDWPETVLFDVRLVFAMFTRVSQVVGARGMNGRYTSARPDWRPGVLERFGGCGGEVVSVGIVFVFPTKGCVAHGHQFDEEEHEDRHQRYPFHPSIFRNGTCEAWVCEGLVGRG